jgi:hypothetical protein
MVMQWLLSHHLPCLGFVQYDWLNNNNDNINVWSMTNVLLYSIALVNVLINGHGYLSNFVLVNALINGHGYLSNFVLVNALINLNDWPMLVLNQSQCFQIQSFFLWSILLKWLFNVNGNINLWSMAQCMLLLLNYSSMFHQCYLVPNEKKLCVSIFGDCKAYVNYVKWIEIWEIRFAIEHPNTQMHTHT